MNEVEILRSWNLDKIYSNSSIKELISELVGGDVWGLIVNNEVIFNSFNDNLKTLKDILIDDAIREQILLNSTSIYRKTTSIGSDIIICYRGQNLHITRIDVDNFELSISNEILLS